MRMLKIGELARQAGLTPDGIRYYERIGVLRRAPRSASGYRQYPEAAVDRLRVVRNAQRIGFSLREIAAFLRVRDNGGRPCDQVRAGAGRILDEVDRQIAELIEARRDLERTLREWDQRLAAATPGEPVRLLERVSPDRRGADIHSFERRRSSSRARARHAGPSTPQSKRS